MASVGPALARTEPAHAAMDIVVTVAKYIRVAPTAPAAVAAAAASTPPAPAAVEQTALLAPATQSAPCTIAMNIKLDGTPTVTALAEDGSSRMETFWTTMS
eukprot:SAG31_NODE_6066_length_2185_cov_2.341802_3_plen_101_part_00